MNFSEYLTLIENPVYKAKKKRTKVKDNPKNPPEGYDGYQVWGSNGMDGGYAIEERPVKEEVIMELSREEMERDAKRKADAEATRRRFGPSSKDQKKTDLAKGEVKKFDKASGKWVSNKSSSHPRSTPLEKGEVRSINKSTGEWESNRKDKPFKKPLHKGEVRKFNKDSGSWESNKD